MIPKNAYSYCCEDIGLIENYDLAVADKTQTWDCHHRLEIELGLSANDLKKQGLFFNRPASELIFLTHAEHTRLHDARRQHTDETKSKMSANNARYWLGKHLSPEHVTKISTANYKPVYQIDQNTGKIIKEWKSIKEAAESLGIRHNCIVACCRGHHKTAGGFIWKYVEVH